MKKNRDQHNKGNRHSSHLGHEGQAGIDGRVGYDKEFEQDHAVTPEFCYLGHEGADMDVPIANRENQKHADGIWSMGELEESGADDHYREPEWEKDDD